MLPGMFVKNMIRSYVVDDGVFCKKNGYNLHCAHNILLETTPI